MKLFWKSRAKYLLDRYGKAYLLQSTTCLSELIPVSSITKPDMHGKGGNAHRVRFILKAKNRED